MKEDINARARALYEDFVDSIVDLFHGPLLACIRHQLWRLGCADLEADEIFHEAMIRFLEKRPDLNVIPLFPWFSSVTQHVIIDHLRKYGNRMQGMGEHEVAIDAHPGETKQWLEQVTIKEALASLPENWGFVVEMLYYHGYTQDELASLLDVNRSQIDFYIRSARERLKKNKSLIELVSKKKQVNPYKE
jgi:RNA polymerase sigma factor (sigma-70 family)